MSFTESILGAATTIFEKTARKSAYYAQIAKLNVRIAADGSSLKELYAKLGEAYFNGIESGENGSAEFAKELCEKIVEVKAVIEANKAEVQRIKDEEKSATEAEAAAKAAEVEAEPFGEDEVEITIEVPEPKTEAPEQPIGTLYVDNTESDSEGN